MTTSAISPENCILRSNPIHGAAESRQVDSELLGKSATLHKLFVTRPFFYWSAILGKNQQKSRSCLADEDKGNSYKYIKEDQGYDSFSDVGESRVWWRADFQSGSRVLKKVF